jgi:hypothetical protein
MPHHIAEKWVLHPSFWENVETGIHVVNVLLHPCKRAYTCLFLACQRVVCAVASGLENLPFSGPVSLVAPSDHLLRSPYLWLRLTMPVFHSLLSPVSLEQIAFPMWLTSGGGSTFFRNTLVPDYMKS